MASNIDIFNISGGTTGNQTQGQIRILYPGDPTIDGRNGETYNPIDIEIKTVVSISNKYDGRYSVDGVELSLKARIDAACTGDTIFLNVDEVITDTIPIDKSINIIGRNSLTLSAPSTTSQTEDCFIISNGANISFRDINFDNFRIAIDARISGSIGKEVETFKAEYCDFQNCEHGINFQNLLTAPKIKYAQLSHLTFKNVENPVFFHQPFVNLEVSHCHITGSTNWGLHLGTTDNDTNEEENYTSVHCHHNFIHGVGNSGDKAQCILISCNIADIHNNYVANSIVTGVDSTAEFSCIYVKTRMSNIHDNYAVDAGGIILKEGNTPGLGNIYGNIIEAFTQSGILKRTSGVSVGAGIYNTHNNWLKNMSISNGPSGNSVTNNRVDKFDGVPLFFTLGPSNYQVSGNLSFSGVQLTAFYDETSQTLPA